MQVPKYGWSESTEVRHNLLHMYLHEAGWPGCPCCVHPERKHAACRHQRSQNWQPCGATVWSGSLDNLAAPQAGLHAALTTALPQLAPCLSPEPPPLDVVSFPRGREDASEPQALEVQIRLSNSSLNVMHQWSSGMTSRIVAEQRRGSVNQRLSIGQRQTAALCAGFDMLFGLMQASAMAASVREAARVLADFVERVFQSGLHVSGNPKVTAVPSYATPDTTSL